MTNKTFIADFPNLQLVEKVTMAKPNLKKWLGLGTDRASEYYDFDCEKYRKHLASLTHYPATWLTKEQDKKEMVEGKDFKLTRGKQIHKTDQQQWQEMSVSEKDECFEMIATPIALPLQEEGRITWEVFLDVSYYDMWAVRPKGDRSFTSESLFHLPSQQEARNLAKYLSTLTPTPPPSTVQESVDEKDWVKRYSNLREHYNMIDSINKLVADVIAWQSSHTEQQGDAGKAITDLIKIQKEYIDFLGNESAKYVHFCGIHGMKVPNEVFEKGQDFRNQIARFELLIALTSKNK